jgi:hypothetical protein
MSYSYHYDNYPSGTVNNNNLSTRRSNLVEPSQNYPSQNYHPNGYTYHDTYHDIDQPQNAHFIQEKENAVQEYQDVEEPQKKYNKQKDQTISKSPVKWYKNTRTILQMFKSNFLLIFLPPAIIMKKFNVDESILFFFNFLAIIPMAKIMTVGINDLSARLHPVRKNIQFKLNRLLLSSQSFN